MPNVGDPSGRPIETESEIIFTGQKSSYVDGSEITKLVNLNGAKSIIVTRTDKFDTNEVDTRIHDTGRSTGQFTGTNNNAIDDDRSANTIHADVVTSDVVLNSDYVIDFGNSALRRPAIDYQLDANGSGGSSPRWARSEIDVFVSVDGSSWGTTLFHDSFQNENTQSRPKARAKWVDTDDRTFRYMKIQCVGARENVEDNVQADIDVWQGWDAKEEFGTVDLKIQVRDVDRDEWRDWETNFAVHDPLSALLPLSEDKSIGQTTGLDIQSVLPSNATDLRFVLVLAQGVTDPSVTVLKVF
jgi:hypothetical protein